MLTIFGLLFHWASLWRSLFPPPIIIMLAYMWALKDYTQQQQPGWKCLVQRDRNRNSFVIIISTDSLMPHDCLETFSHFVIMLASVQSSQPTRTRPEWVFPPVRHCSISRLIRLSDSFTLLVIFSLSSLSSGQPACPANTTRTSHMSATESGKKFFSMLKKMLYALLSAHFYMRPFFH